MSDCRAFIMLTANDNALNRSSRIDSHARVIRNTYDKTIPPNATRNARITYSYLPL